MNIVKTCNIKSSFKSDHSVVVIELHVTNHARGPGYFKMNNSILTNEDYQTQIKAGIDETVTYNQNTDPNTLWEILKGPIRNMTIKYVTQLKKETNKTKTNIKKETRRARTSTDQNKHTSERSNR